MHMMPILGKEGNFAAANLTFACPLFLVHGFQQSTH